MTKKTQTQLAQLIAALEENSALLQQLGKALEKTLNDEVLVEKLDGFNGKPLSDYVPDDKATGVVTAEIE